MTGQVSCTHGEAVVSGAVEVGNCRSVLVLLVLLLRELDRGDGLAGGNEETRREDVLQSRVAPSPGSEGHDKLVPIELAAVGALDAADVASVLGEDERLHLGVGDDLGTTGVDLLVELANGTRRVNPSSCGVVVRFCVQSNVADDGTSRGRELSTDLLRSREELDLGLERLRVLVRLLRVGVGQSTDHVSRPVGINSFLRTRVLTRCRCPSTWAASSG